MGLHFMGKATSTPLLFQSKLLCFSLFYLFTSLFLALYTTLSQSQCLFRSSPFDPIHTPLFSYPPAYGEHKYAIPTHRSTCSSPVFFSDYWTVLKEIQDLCKNSLLASPVLTYMQGQADSFGGNFSTQKRFSYFDNENSSVEVPCGFLKKFPIRNYDQAAMENCKGVVVVSAIFNDHDKIRQPRGLGSKTLDNVCFFMFVDDITLKGLDYHKIISRKSGEYKIGAWRIVRVSSKDLYGNPAMNGVIPKYLVHRLFPNSKFSIWIDAKLQLMVDPLLLIHTLVVSEKADIAISKHPYYVHTMEEAMATARWKKWWDVDSLKTQMETYCENGLQPWSSKKLPYSSDVPDSALILRKHELGNNLFSCLLFNEMEAFNPRDQLAFAYVRDHMRPKLKINMFEVEVFEQVAVEYRHNLKKRTGATSSGEHKTKRTKRARADLLYVNGSCCSRCQKYLLDMWGESQ
ncbi:alkaline ceramidase TOD1 [Alnus glutinosa]|uniref:alkaline ceramidase TOD1 n=1 Tax=Alnus glutinosa TaxID=3517 RepID=UPI002D787195|nr:alkaline ceramidase TOD1 [Alnus glutinosa]